MSAEHRKLVMEAGAKALVDKMDAGITGALKELGSGNALVIARFILDIAVQFHARMLRRAGALIGTHYLIAMVGRGFSSTDGHPLPAPVDLTLESVRKLITQTGGKSEVIELEARPGEMPS